MTHNTDNRIQLFRLPQGWMARFIGPHASDVRRAFGTDTIQTAYTDKAAGEDVAQAIRRLNPGAVVFIGSSS